MWRDKLLQKSFIASVCLNTAVVACLGAGNFNKAIHGTPHPTQPPPPTRLIALEMSDPPKQVASKSKSDSSPDSPDAPTTNGLNQKKIANKQKVGSSGGASTAQSGKDGIIGKASGALLPERHDPAKKPPPRLVAKKPASVRKALVKPDTQLAAKPKGDLNRGDVHLHRPAAPPKPRTIRLAHGVLDLRKLRINAHYMIDGSKVIPWRILPNKVIGKGRIISIGSSGNSSSCIPAGGGNTFVRTGDLTILWGKNNITGTKFCYGGGGTMGGANPSLSHIYGSGNPDDQTDFASQQTLQANYASFARGPYRALEGELSPMDIGWEPGAPVNPLHLPEFQSDYGTMTPGVWVPKDMRRIVVSPKKHRGSKAPTGTPDGKNPKPTPFHLVPKTVGSHSERGNILWSQEYPKKPSKGVKDSKSKDPEGRSQKGKGTEDGGGDGTGLLGEYYLGMDFEKFLFKRPDRNIDFLWTSTQVDKRLPMGQAFSVRWTGTIKPRYSETYTFYTTSDDGVRLWIDGKLLLANWTIHGPSEDVTQVSLEAGKEYPIKLEYFEKNGLSDEVIKLYWESPSQRKEYVPESCLFYPKPDDEDADN